MFRFLALCLTMARAAVEMPPCALVGQGYNQTTGNPVRIETENALKCQERCKRTEICAFFTWFNNSQGCWLQSSAATLSITNDQVISGPVRCPSEIEGSTIVKALNDSTGAAIPWWAWLFIGLLVAVGGLLCLACLCCAQNKRSKRSNKLDKKRQQDEEAPAAQAHLPLAANAQMPMAANAQMQMPMAAPVQMPQAYLPVATNAQDLFDRLDKDGDGVLSQSEMAAAMGQMYTAQPAAASPSGRYRSYTSISRVNAVAAEAPAGQTYYTPVGQAMPVPQEPAMAVASMP